MGENAGVSLSESIVNYLNPLYIGGIYCCYCWMSLFVILGVLGLFCCFYSIVDGKLVSKQCRP